MSGEENAVISLAPETVTTLSGNVEQLGAYLVQMAQIMTAMQRRLDQLEESERKATLNHEEVKTIQKQVRDRAAEYCEKYQISSPENTRAISGAIRRAVLTRYQVKDLHDVPAIARQAVGRMIETWSDVRLMMKCRERLRTD